MPIIGSGNCTETHWRCTKNSKIDLVRPNPAIVRCAMVVERMACAHFTTNGGFVPVIH